MMYQALIGAAVCKRTILRLLRLRYDHLVVDYLAVAFGGTNVVALSGVQAPAPFSHSSPPLRAPNSASGLIMTRTSVKNTLLFTNIVP